MLYNIHITMVTDSEQCQRPLELYRQAHEREARFAVYDEIRARNVDAAPEQIGADVAEAVRAVRNSPAVNGPAGGNKFAVLQLSGCAGCEVSLLNADAWVDRYKLVYMPLVISAYDVPEVDVLLVSGGVRTDEDLYNLRRAVQHAHQTVAVGTCAISGGVASLGDRDEVRALFLAEEGRRHVPRLLPRCRPIDTFVTVDRYLPGCPPTPELFMVVLFNPPDFKPSRIVCQECGRKKLKDVRPDRLVGFQRGGVLPDVCLINQGYLCIGSSTRGGCRAPCPRAGHPCVGCRGPSDVLIEQASSAWFASIERVFAAMTDVPASEVEAGLRSPQLALFLFQFSDYSSPGRPPRPKEKVL